jgi:hypothetical protein
VLYLQKNTVNVVILTNCVNHDTTQPYSIRFVGLSDNKETILTGVANISANPARYLQFSIVEPTNIVLDYQLYDVYVYDSTNTLVAYQVARVKGATDGNSIYNDTQTNKFYN